MYDHTCIMCDMWHCISFRCFLSAGTPAQSPRKSRLVEAVCSLLLEKHPTAQRGDRSAGSYRSRWKLVVCDYNAIKSRLANSTIEDIALYAINETTLKTWFQDSVRQEEVKLLLLGQQLPDPQMCSTSPLPAAIQVNPDKYQPPVDGHPFDEPEDRTSRFVNIRKNASAQRQPPSALSSAPPSALSSAPPSALSSAPPSAVLSSTLGFTSCISDNRMEKEETGVYFILSSTLGFTSCISDNWVEKEETGVCFILSSTLNFIFSSTLNRVEKE